MRTPLKIFYHEPAGMTEDEDMERRCRVERAYNRVFEKALELWRARKMKDFNKIIKN